MSKTKIAIFLATGFEEIEAISSIDVLRRAEFDVQIISVTDNLTVKGNHNIQVVADKLINEVDLSSFDGLVLPGGQPGVSNLMEVSLLRDALIKQAGENKLIAAICAAPQMLGMLGLADGKEVTHYPGAIEYLDKAIKKPQMAAVEDGKIITGSSPGGAIQFALQIVDHFTDTQNMLRIHELLVMNY
ncbi:DJ-1 family glyoxalase III [Spiroplasma endosymbiont of Labia minor]|uniref:DJ-1 family glyoxalase III n=1 Tax=Spiroplasma endosymbiont of Labia minor TaxID=3066305 RepID=UPI0030CC2356